MFKEVIKERLQEYTCGNEIQRDHHEGDKVILNYDRLMATQDDLERSNIISIPFGG